MTDDQQTWNCPTCGSRFCGQTQPAPRPVTAPGIAWFGEQRPAEYDPARGDSWNGVTSWDRTGSIGA